MSLNDLQNYGIRNARNYAEIGEIAGLDGEPKILVIAQKNPLGTILILPLSLGMQLRCPFPPRHLTEFLMFIGIGNVSDETPYFHVLTEVIASHIGQDSTATPMSASFNVDSPIEQVKVIQEGAELLELYTVTWST